MPINDLFEPKPAHWGLRGDPYLWKSLCEYFANSLMPATSKELQDQLQAAYEKITGVSIDEDEPVLVQKFAHGGMSSGYIDPCFWRDQGFPLLLKRLAKITAQQSGNGDAMTRSADNLAPWYFSQSGLVLFLNDRPAAHLFGLVSGGVAWLDHGWTDPLVSFHVVHYIEGQLACTGDRTWSLVTEDGEIFRIWADPDGNRPDGDREAARKALIREFDLLLLPDL